MHFVALEMDAPDGPPIGITTAELAEALARFQDRSDRVEHIRVHENSTGYRVGLLLLADEYTAAVGHARQLCRRTIAGTPRLSGWQLAPSRTRDDR